MVEFGSAFAYVTTLKLAATSLPRKYFGTATGVVTGCGMVAEILTDIYLTHSVKINGFHFVMYFPLFMGIDLIVAILLIIRDKPKEEATTEMAAISYRQLGDYLLGIIKNRQMWFIGIVGSLLYLPSSVFLDVWAIPYLHYVHHLSPEQASWGVSIVLFGWIMSSFGSGVLSNILGTRKIPLLIASFLAAIVASLILYLNGLPIYVLHPLLFLFGICCGPHPLCFTLSKENNPHKISGTAIAFANFVIMMGGFILRIIRLALSIMPIGLSIAGIVTLFIK